MGRKYTSFYFEMIARSAPRCIAARKTQLRCLRTPRLCKLVSVRAFQLPISLFRTIAFPRPQWLNTPTA